jgi:hypothetical protein
MEGKKSLITNRLRIGELGKCLYINLKTSPMLRPQSLTLAILKD